MSVSRADRKLEITLLQERNAGTFARVYMARARAPDGLTRIVAVKVLREKWTETLEIIARTRDEAQLLARLQHPNILRVEAITEVEGQPAIVMEFVHGADLGQLLTALGERNQSIPPRVVYEIMERVLSALAAAYFKVPVGQKEPLHAVHRDIKPSNIMISSEGALKVLDFGTARFEDAERVARTEAFRFGSLKYMSPERREGDRGDHTSDIYSVGLLLLELLQGKVLETVPLDVAAHDAFIQQAFNDVPDFGLPNTAWDDSLRQTLSRMLAYDPEMRLDAQQCVQLFRPFKDQAIGESLTAFAEQVVAPLTGALNAEPEEETTEGSRFFLTEDASDEDGELKLVPEPKVDTRSSDTSKQPVVASPPPATVDQALVDTQRPGYAIRDLETEDLDFDESTDPAPAPRTTPVAQVGRASTSAPAAPRTRPAPAKPTSSVLPAAIYATIGCVVIAVLIGVLGGTAFFASWRANQAMAPSADAPTDVEGTSFEVEAAIDELTEAATGSGGGAPSSVSVELQAGDPTVQWIRLFNTAGERLLTAKPDTSGDLSPGTYELRVKVVARSALSGQVSIEEDTFLSCKPATMGRVRCTDRDGKKRLVIRP